MIYSILPHSVAQDILSIPLSRTSQDIDAVVWPYDKTGEVTVKSVYILLSN